MPPPGYRSFDHHHWEHHPGHEGQRWFGHRHEIHHTVGETAAVGTRTVRGGGVVTMTEPGRPGVPATAEGGLSGTPGAPVSSGFSLRNTYGGIPAWAWIAGGGTLLLLYLRWRKRQLTASSTSGASAMFGGGSAADLSAPLPGDYGLPFGGYSGYYSPPAPVASGGQITGGAVAPDGSLTTAAPAPTVSAGSPASDQFSIGQVVNPISNERIVSSVYSPTYGWLNLTNLGGIYTGGGGSGGDIGKLQYGGSYLGYAATTPNPAGEIGVHGKFGQGGLQLLPGGGYVEQNLLGEKYQFGK